MFKVNVPFPDRAELNEIVRRTTLADAAALDSVLDGERIMALRQILAKVVVADPMRDYAVRLVLGTHPTSDGAGERVRRYVRYGASPRATQALIRAARVRALVEKRAHVSFEDVRFFAPEVLGHRVLLNYDGQAENVRVADLIAELTAQIHEEGPAA